MENLTKEQLLTMISNTSTKKPRKKQVLDDEKQTKMLLKLSQMRDIAKANREAKKKATEDSTVAKPDLNQIDIFEKKYGTVFEKMTDILVDLNNNTKDVLKLKREKAIKKELPPASVPEPISAPAPISAPEPKEIIQKELPTIENGGVVPKFEQGNYIGLEAVKSPIISINKINETQMMKQQSISNPLQPLTQQSIAKKLTPMPSRDMFSKNKHQRF